MSASTLLEGIELALDELQKIPGNGEDQPLNLIQDIATDARDLAERVDELLSIILEYVVANARAPSNRDEAELDRVARALVEAVTTS